MRFCSVELWEPIGRPGEDWRARRKDAGQVRSGAASVVVPRRLWVRVGPTERVGLGGTVHGGRFGTVTVVTTGIVPKFG